MINYTMEIYSFMHQIGIVCKNQMIYFNSLIENIFNTSKKSKGYHGNDLKITKVINNKYSILNKRIVWNNNLDKGWRK